MKRGYDQYGNRIYMSKGEEEYVYSYNVLNQLIANGSEPNRMQFLAMGQNYRGWRSGKDLKIAKIFFKVDIRDHKTQRSVLDLINSIK